MNERAKVVRSTDLPVQVGKPDALSGRKWLNQQVPYRNFAGKHHRLDEAVQSWVVAHKERFRGRMQTTMSRWATNWAAANGEAVWHEHDDDLHVPETKKALDSKVARVEEALLEFDPLFEVEGKRDDLPRFTAQLIGSFTAQTMENAGFRELVQPSARDAELCNVAAVKVSWDYQEDWVVERMHELRFTKDGTPYRHDERKMRKAVVKNGPRYDLVDPFWFFYDLDAGKIQDCEYIGDESEMFLHVAEQKAKQGLFSEEQVRKIREKRTTANDSTSIMGVKAEQPDLFRKARTIASPWLSANDTRSENNATKLRAVECWGWYDFGDDGYDGVTDPLGGKITGTHRVVATLLSGTVVRFQLNPFDRKFVPYAVARINRNGHEMASPANFDSVVQMNAQYDAIHSTLMKTAHLGAAPIIITRNDTDLPDSILGIVPGQVLKSTGDWDIVKVPDTPPQTLMYWHTFMRREIEENSGALRVFESPQGTATETERKVQEQQRMVRNSIRAIGDLGKQVALLTYWMTGQFSTGAERFRVMGKAASVLGKTAEITPDILQEDVDFRFVGVESMHTFGSRLSGMRQWANAWGPVLAQMPGINLMALARNDYELSVGRAQMNEIFPDATAPWETMPQQEENEMLLAGHRVPVSKNDDDMAHIEAIMPLLATEGMPDYIKQLLVDHINEHMQQAQQKEAEQKAQQQQADQQAALMGAQGGEAGVDRPPAEGGMPAQQKGVTPGPTQNRTVARTGRQGNGTSQSQRVAAS